MNEEADGEVEVEKNATHAGPLISEPEIGEVDRIERSADNSSLEKRQVT